MLELSSFFRTENKLKSHEKVCKNKQNCGIAIPSEKDNILDFNQNSKSDKMPYITYADIESLIKKTNGSVKIFWKILEQKKLESKFLVDIQCQLYGLLII